MACPNFLSLRTLQTDTTSQRTMQLAEGVTNQSGRNFEALDIGVRSENLYLVWSIHILITSIHVSFQIMVSYFIAIPFAATIVRIICGHNRTNTSEDMIMICYLSMQLFSVQLPSLG